VAAPAKASVYVATTNGVVELEDGQVFNFAEGKTRISSDSPLAKAHKGKILAAYFEPVDARLHYDPATPPAEGEVPE
jgi:hypothetical protein